MQKSTKFRFTSNWKIGLLEKKPGALSDSNELHDFMSVSSAYENLLDAIGASKIFANEMCELSNNASETKFKVFTETNPAFQDQLPSEFRVEPFSKQWAEKTVMKHWIVKEKDEIKPGANLVAIGLTQLESEINLS